MATNEPRGGNGPADRGEGYERRDANVKGLLQFAFWMAVVIAITMFAMRLTFDYFKKIEPLGATVSPLVKPGERELPPSPVLQVQPHQELIDYCSTEQEAVNSYGWVNQESGVVHIPVDRAMELVLTKGLPARSAAEAPAGAPTVAPPMVAGDTDVQGQCAYLTEPTGPVEKHEGEEKK